MKRAVALCLALPFAVALGCREQPSVTSPKSPRISAAISDGAHEGGNIHFFFLPPMVPKPAFSGTFNPNLGPVAQVCTLAVIGGTTACDPSIPVINLGPMQQDASNQQYQVNWNTGTTNVVTTSTYRIQVFAANELLGFADVQPITNGSMKNKVTGDTVALVDGRTLPIKVRIESGALCSGPLDCGEGTVGPAGATIVTGNTFAGALFPPGALTNTVTVLIAQSTSEPCLPVDLVQHEGCYNFVTSPPGQFQSNVTVAICVPTEEFQGIPSSALHWFILHRLDLVGGQPVVTPLPNAPATFLPCDESETAPPPSTIGLRGMDRWLALAKAGVRHLIGLFTPRKLYAFHLGVGGSTCCFSQIGWALPAIMTKNAGDGQTAVSGTAVAIPPSVVLRDSGGGPVVGETVTFSVGSGGGSITGATQVTDQGGVATVGSWTLGSSLGSNTLIATSHGAVGSPRTFTATATAPPVSIVGGTYNDREGGVIGTAFLYDPTDAAGLINAVAVQGPESWNGGQAFSCGRYQPSGTAGNRSLCWVFTSPITGQYTATATIGDVTRSANFSINSGLTLDAPVVTVSDFASDHVSIQWTALSSAKSFLVRVNPTPFTGAVTVERVESGDTRSTTFSGLTLPDGTYQAVVFAFDNDVITPGALGTGFNIGAQGVGFTLVTLQ
jgi:hypothetical protein